MNHEYIFVYGTLRRNTGESRHHLLERYSDFIGDGYVHGKLYEAGGYPGLKMTECSKQKVYGEVYRLSNADYVFKVLDDYEGCSDKSPEPHEYRRIQVRVHLADGRSLKAWAYEYNHPAEDLELIPSGNYAQYLKEKPRKANQLGADSGTQ